MLLRRLRSPLDFFFILFLNRNIIKDSYSRLIELTFDIFAQRWVSCVVGGEKKVGLADAGAHEYRNKPVNMGVAETVGVFIC